MLKNIHQELLSIYPWQQSQWKVLFATRQQHRLPHALLLMGPQGLGKLDFARELAKVVLCESMGELACGHCRSCHLFALGNHPDFFFVTVEEKTKSIKVDQIRALTTSLSQTSHQGGYQVAIIYPAEAMNHAAANAFLKTLEEPAGKVLLLLVSHQIGYLPATIISRCHKIGFASANHETALEWLQSRLSTKQPLSLLLKLAHHAPLAVSKLIDAKYISLRDALLKHLWQVATAEENAIAPVKAMLQQDLSWLMHAFISILMDVLRLKLHVDFQYIVNEDHIHLLQQLSNLVDKNKLLSLLIHLQEAQKLMMNSASVNTQLMLESLLLQWKEGLRC